MKGVYQLYDNEAILANFCIKKLFINNQKLLDMEYKKPPTKRGRWLFKIKLNYLFLEIKP